MSDEIMLTEGSYRKLQAELDYLRTTKRAEIAEALRKARGFGDLSENFEYHSARRDQGILNGKIAELERTLELAKIIDESEIEEGVVSMGSVVTVRDLEEQEEWDYTLVDAVQADPINDRISIHSPVGEALMGKRVGDVVEVEIPAGTARYEIVAVGRE
jgi:transcription elongation factor GreA